MLMAYGLWLMAYGLWLMAYGLWPMAWLSSLQLFQCWQIAFDTLFIDELP